MERSPNISGDHYALLDRKIELQRIAAEQQDDAASEAEGAIGKHRMTWTSTV
jgi:hypothetical protein